MKPPSIVWLLVDSIRSSPRESEDDIRGKLPFMERFGRESVEFTTCVTTAPSTIMSVTAMMTGLPAYFLARNYDDFRFDSGYRHSLGGILKEHGYSSWAFLRGMETREKFRAFLDPVPRAYWPRGLRHGEKWKNADLNRLLDRVLEGAVPKPAFLFFHFSPQTEAERDPHMSERVEAVWGRLLEAGFDLDETIYVLCSDHGYPPASTGITSEWEKKSRITHDLVLTDDNILIPLYIRYPGCRPAKIDTPVSSLDLFPTLLELARIPGAKRIEEATDGISLVPLIESGGGQGSYKRRFFRCDSRLMLQTARSTAIRSRDFKYIRFHDEHRLALGNVSHPTTEVLLDLREDPMERHNLLLAEESLSPSQVELLQRFRSQFERSERRGLEFQIDYLLWRQRDALRPSRVGDQDPGPLRILLVFEPNTAGYLRIGVEAISRLHPDAEMDVIADETELPIGHAKERPYDLTILFVQNPSDPVVSDLLRILKSVRARKRLLLDCNFNAYRRQNYWYYRFRTLMERLPYLREEPRMLLDQVRIAARLLRRRLLSRLGRWERWEEAEAPSATEE